MTKEERLIVTAYTGVLMTTFSEFHEFAEAELKRPILTHEFGSQDVIDENVGFGKSVVNELKEKVKDRFLALAKGENK